MDNQPLAHSGILHFGPVSLELRPGDVLMGTADALCVPVDGQCLTDTGLFGVLVQRGAFKGSPLGTRRRLGMGDAIIAPIQGFPTPRAILVGMVNEQTGTVSRENIQAGLTQAMKICDKEGFSTLATPFLGHAQSKLDYDIGAGLLIKTVRTFGLAIPKSLRHVCLYAFNADCHIACMKQFFSYEQSL